MITLLSPAKSLDYSNKPNTTNYTIPRFLKESAILINHLTKLSSVEISELMNVSEKIADLNLNRFATWSGEEIEKFNPLIVDSFIKTKQAILAFDGDVYDGLDAKSLSKEELHQSQNHIRIISGLYGLLRPLDVIQPYRLEMGTTLKIGNNNNLYKFWGDKITTMLINDLKETNSPKFVVNCASMEYSKAINTVLLQNQNIPLISPVFTNRDNKGELKIIAIYAKKLRGEFARFTITEKIENINELTNFSDWNKSNYFYDADLSKEISEKTREQKIVFTNSKKADHF
jgi:cytoplasmic iron level regulating protein YaaA (DUF328/UPF0246 family)